MAICTVRKALAIRFLRENIGIEAIHRQEFINQHVTPFANELYNEQPQELKAIIVKCSTRVGNHPQE